MSDAEARSLGRAAVALLLLSLLRWGGVVLRHTPGQPDPTGSPPESVVDELADATDRAVADSDRRSRPLQDGERLDPNRASAAELDRLPGVGPSTARAIVAARDSMAFRRADDLAAVRGIGPALVRRIEPYLDFDSPPPEARTHRRAANIRVDVNHADASALETLPGVGPSLAARIIETRRERPFADVGDLDRVPGIGPATVERLRALVTVSRGR